ncbi:ARM repeat-containing protein [Dendrothele bispora CBS 962.96]|uniref:ARM repeat-containing protein n=1 Tax=Dendrothele bispora (strain CBS 962.96) TaxID=1314807 RepID=A0A4S8MU79_DENBC|nr:ARM repeat-containing protein [Dendrothele bispora CBS 962.96]
MDVPFIKSGASSRSHYVLVKNLESTSSLQAADHIIADQVRSTLHDLADPKLSLRRCKDCLIILLYCQSQVSDVSLLDIPLENALSNAATLAAAGQTVADRRIGYRFCAEIMPRNHPLQLLLVNTLRKDLESASISRICLALDYLISSISEDVIPAIQSRLEDLLQHNSPHVRRRVLLVFKSLSQYEPELLEKIADVAIRRMSDRERSVCTASLSVLCTLCQVSQTARPLICRSLDEQLHSTWAASQHGKKKGCLVNLLNTFQVLGTTKSEKNVQVITGIITAAAQNRDHVLLRAAFLALPPFDVQELSIKTSFSPIRDVTSLLSSHDPNDQYLFLTCLDRVNPVFWAGTSVDFPAILKEWEVGQVMRFLDSSESLVRKMTVRILNRVDGNIVDSYYSQSLQTLPQDLNPSAKTEYGCRLLEVLEIRTAEDGENYAKNVHDLLKHMDDAASHESNQPVILEDLVEMVLRHIRQASPDFRLQCATTFLTYLSELDVLLGSMELIITAALSCEYLIQVALSPQSLLLGLSSRLQSCPPAVQDACLLAMTRVAAECEEISQDIVENVSSLGQNSRRYIRRRCEQFVQLQSERDRLARIAQGAKSSSLPDFLESLQSEETDSQSSRSHLSTPLHGPVPLSSSDKSSRKLRYTAYSTPGDASSAQEDLSGGPLSSQEHQQSLKGIALASLVDSTANERQGISRNDLIALDSPAPLIEDPDDELEDISFEQAWQDLTDANNARGWYNDTMDKVVRQLQTLTHVKVQVIESSLPPFVAGELKVLIMPKEDPARGNFAVLRLREEEDNSCLWRLRAGSSTLHESVKNVLS